MFSGFPLADSYRYENSPYSPDLIENSISIERDNSWKSPEKTAARRI
jgi:hypothetical protein